MRKGHISERHNGKHPNNRPGAQKVNSSGSVDTQGRNVGRREEHAGNPRVMDSPPFVSRACGAVKADGSKCRNTLKKGEKLCFGHSHGNGAIDG